MFVPEKNKLNKFKLVRIPTNREYFARFGEYNLPASAYSGDELGCHMQSKIDQISALDAYDRRMQFEEYQKSVDNG